MARPSLQNNVKFKALVRRLNLPRPYVRGLLDTMWDVANESGNPVLGAADDVEAAAEWPGKSGSLFSALRTLHFIDVLEDGRWVIHDYWDHAPKYVKNRVAMEAKRKGSFRPKNDWKVDSSNSKDLRSICVPLKDTVAHCVPTPAPAPNTSLRDVSAAGADVAPHAPDSAQAGKRRSPHAGRTKTTKAEKNREEPRPEHAELREYFRSEWKVRYGADYVWSFGKDDSILRRILDGEDRIVPKTKAILTRYLRDDDPWLVERTHLFGLLPSRINRYRAIQGQDKPDDNGFVRVERSDDEWEKLLLEGSQ